jgi:hypothetical protein
MYYRFAADELIVGLIFGLQAFCSVVFSFLIGQVWANSHRFPKLFRLLTDREVAVINLQLLVFALSMTFLLVIPSVLAVFFLNIFLGLTLGGIIVMVCKLASDRAQFLLSQYQIPTEASMSIFNLCWFGGFALGALLGGLPETDDSTSQLYVLSGTSFACVLWCLPFAKLASARFTSGSSSSVVTAS